MSRKTIIILCAAGVVLCIAGVLLYYGFAGSVFKDDTVYTAGDTGAEFSHLSAAQLKTEGIIPFRKMDGLPADILETSIPVTISPDGKSVYYMDLTHDIEGEKAIKGEDLTSVEFIKYDIETKTPTLIAVCRFISLAKWNGAGTKLAFLSGDKVFVYDVANNKTDELVNNAATYFGWSPEGNKIYTEHPNLPNGSTYYTDSQKTVKPYEDPENLYFKGILDNDYYYATKRAIVDEITAKARGTAEEIKTVVANAQKNIVKELPGGRFRDSYGRAMLQTGLSGFELHYFPDINKQEVKVLTKEYVYDAKFVSGGRIAYITKDKNIEANDFLLTLADAHGNETGNMTISSSRICLSPDGETGYGSGPRKEVIDFTQFKLKESRIPFVSASSEEEAVFKAVRGAMDVYYRFELIKDGRDEAGISKYFIDSSNPEQWGNFDALMKMRESSWSPDAEHYALHIYWNDFKVDVTERKPLVMFSPRSDRPRATANISVQGRNSSGSGFGMQHSLELIKENGKWYVTGLSTFAESPEAAKMKTIVENMVKDIRQNGSFDGILKGKDVQIGQIQFWRLSDPHLSPDIKTANYCKVYLKVMEDGKEQIYKMVLDKENQNYWKVSKITKDRLSGLF